MTASPIHARIREPRPSELPALRMLLPHACTNPLGRLFLLLFDEAGLSIEGALSFRDNGKALGSIRLEVVPHRRRAGLGTALLSYAETEGRRLGRQLLIADADILREPAAEPFLDANGFVRTSRMTTVEGLTEVVCADWEDVRQRTPPLHHLSPDARIVGINEAPLDQLLKMYTEYISESPQLTGMQRVMRLEHYQESSILMIGNRVIAAMLSEIRDGVLRVPAWFVAPEYRGQLAGLQVRTGMLNRVEPKKDQFKTIQFDFLDKAQATAKIAKGMPYETIAVTARFERILV